MNEKPKYLMSCTIDFSKINFDYWTSNVMWNLPMKKEEYKRILKRYVEENNYAPKREFCMVSPTSIGENLTIKCPAPRGVKFVHTELAEFFFYAHMIRKSIFPFSCVMASLGNTVRNETYHEFGFHPVFFKSGAEPVFRRLSSIDSRHRSEIIIGKIPSLLVAVKIVREYEPITLNLDPCTKKEKKGFFTKKTMPQGAFS